MPSPSNAAPASPRAPPQYPDCVVAHLLANDDGPIDLVSLAVSRPPSATERTISLFYRAGLLDDPIQFVDIAVFGHGLEATVGAVP